MISMTTIRNVLLFFVLININMERIRKSKRELLNSYSDLQHKFINYYREAEDKCASYVFKHKTLSNETGFDQTFIQTRMEYDATLCKFRRLYKKYKYQSDYLHKNLNFDDNLNSDFGNSIKLHRSEKMEKQLQHETFIRRDTVHDFTNTLYNDDKLQRILNKGPNVIPSVARKTKQQLSKEVKDNTLSALHTLTSRISNCPVYKHVN